MPAYKCAFCKAELTLPKPGEKERRLLQESDKDRKRIIVVCPQCGKDNIVEVTTK